jgi:hypothetical protein
LGTSLGTAARKQLAGMPLVFVKNAARLPQLSA